MSEKESIEDESDKKSFKLFMMLDKKGMAYKTNKVSFSDLDKLVAIFGNEKHREWAIECWNNYYKQGEFFGK